MITFVSNHSEFSQRFMIFRDCFSFPQTITILYTHHTTCILYIDDIKWMLRLKSKGRIDILLFEISMQDKKKKRKVNYFLLPILSYKVNLYYTQIFFCKLYCSVLQKIIQSRSRITTIASKSTQDKKIMFTAMILVTMINHCYWFYGSSLVRFQIDFS